MTPVAALVFDWGDTLMRVFPDYDGPMVDWPQVAAVDGAGQVLQQLQEHYRLFVATNAAESSAQQVGAALQRIGLDVYFERIFTMHELGSRKPEPAFFHNLSRRITVPGEACVMIGDDLQSDVSGALQAGWRAIWLNPDSHPSPGLLPLHDADISRLAQLPSALTSFDLPRFQTCLDWLLAEGSPHIILTHVLTVAALSYRMALWMRGRSSDVDPLLTHRGGLLHDLSKAASFYSEDKSKDHGELAAHLLIKHNQPRLAEIARRHLLFRPLEQDSRPETNEQKLVFLMDKLVEGSQMVSLEERINHMRQRYPLDPAKLDALLPLLHDLRAELCAQAGFHPEDLVPRLQATLFDRI